MRVYIIVYIFVASKFKVKSVSYSLSAACDIDIVKRFLSDYYFYGRCMCRIDGTNKSSSRQGSW